MESLTSAAIVFIRGVLPPPLAGCEHPPSREKAFEPAPRGFEGFFVPKLGLAHSSFPFWDSPLYFAQRDDLQAEAKKKQKLASPFTVLSSD